MVEELRIDGGGRTQNLWVEGLHPLVHHLVVVLSRHLFYGTIYSSQFLRVHMRVFIGNTHLIITLGYSTIVIKREEVSFGVIALIRHWLVAALLVLDPARIASGLQL